MKNHPSPAKANATPTELLVRCQALLGQPVDSEQLMELVMQLLAQELIAAKLQGKAISDNLKLLSYLMRYASLKLRAAAQRLREQKAEAKSAASSARSLKPSRSSTTAPAASPAASEEPPSEIIDSKIIKFPGTYANAPRKDETPIQSALHRQAVENKEGFQIDPKLTALPLMGEAPMVATKPHDLI